MSKQISSAADKKVIKDAMREISSSMTRTEAERDLIKEIIKNISENYEIPKKTVRKLARVYHNQNFTKEIEEHEEFELLYENITAAAGTPDNV
jgi:Zn-dependent M32 family carboxypeptidase